MKKARSYDVKQGEKKLRNLWLTMALVGGIAALGAISRLSNESQDVSRPTQQLSSETTPEIQTVVSRQDAEGVTEADFSAEFLERLESYTQERVLAAAQKFWDRDGVPQEERPISAEGVYVELAGKKLAIIRLRMGRVTPQAMIFGVQGAELVRVLCLSNQPTDVPVTSGPCAGKVEEVFGVSFPKIGNDNG